MNFGFWHFVMVLMVVCLGLWLWNGFVALYVCLCFSAISFFGLLLMRVSEWISPSKVATQTFYLYYGAAVVVPLLVTLLAIYGFKFSTAVF